jgi:cyanophycinase-like exopeptidase
MYPGVTVPSDLTAYVWLLDKANGGDVLVLTADDAPWDIYNPFLFNMSGVATAPNSVTTARFTGREGASNSKLATLLSGASLLFVTGGDQSKYYDYWRNTPVSVALSSNVAVGGSSAGLAIQGEFIFDAEHGSIDSEGALKYPTDSEVSLASSFIAVNQPWMHGVLTDTHFIQRDRMGRLVTFLARVAVAGWTKHDNQTRALSGVLGVGISEHTAVLVDAVSGSATFVGVGPAYFMRNNGHQPTTCEEGQPLSWDSPGVDVWRWDNTTMVGTTFHFDTWTAMPASSGASYNLTVTNGTLVSSQAGGAIY